ncbi:hypothetical protein Psed_5458 [Pseudonocardia dioxanivorans CB1190]|uniref:Secreted protein n=1 Tax=Pseudonocardia dioxanivorans (strain ATCC 55486 / DSM 44775 / JCM 13855 / CB1190) TaxID=675635 RepID=F4CXK8_PSEUX|nr:hypothetical protein [Pseudonocardia dioxanivorans]AEA27591.1 hypothetical protein Psed_5458 [Pseudonocardia dioxanivorans CB1190]
MTTLLVLVLVMAVLSAAATRYGADSRDGDGRTPSLTGERIPRRRHFLRDDLAAIGARIARAATRPQRTPDERALGRGARHDVDRSQGVQSQYPRAKTSTA